MGTTSSKIQRGVQAAAQTLRLRRDRRDAGSAAHALREGPQPRAAPLLPGNQQPRQPSPFTAQRPLDAGVGMAPVVPSVDDVEGNRIRAAVIQVAIPRISLLRSFKSVLGTGAAGKQATVLSLPGPLR